MWAWGRNEYGQSGNGTTNDIYTPVQVGTDRDWVLVTAGTYHTLALKSNGTLWAWGYNGSGQLGYSTTETCSGLPCATSAGQVGSSNKWVSVMAGDFHSIALKSDGTLWTWGLNAGGQLGDGTTVEKYFPIQVGTDNKWIPDGTGGNSFTLVLKSDGTLWAWGSNLYGQLGDGTTTDSFSPKQIDNDNNWYLISVGTWHTSALKTNGTLWAWGSNMDGQLGDGTTIDKLYPVFIGNVWIYISAGNHHTVALKPNGTLWTWGYNYWGQLGDGTTSSKSSPVRIGSDNDWVSIAAGSHYTLALKSNGTLWSWGGNFRGQLGDGTTTNRSSPMQIGSGSNWVSIVCGHDHAVAMKSDGTLWTWGSNEFGQLGRSSSGTCSGYSCSKSPAQVGTDNDWNLIAAGTWHTLAIKSNGTLWSWGYNNFGQLGNGTIVNSLSPVQIGADNNWSSITPGRGSFTIAHKSNGTIWSWGDNSDGQLGNGTTIGVLSPAQIGTDNHWISSAKGGHSTLALKSDGTLWAWGSNAYGSLGDGTTSDRYFPVQITHIDSDGDGYPSGPDCDDTNASINPGAVEICDGIDNDCDTLIDDADPGVTGRSTWYADTDADGYGGPASSTAACTQPVGYAANNTDCNDGNAAIHPGAAEVCNGVDDNCNGQTDEGGVCGSKDLIISALTEPATGIPGSPINITDTTKNNGTGTAGASTTKFYWSANNTLDAGDTLLGSRAVPALAAGATNTGTTTVTVPANACAAGVGTYYVIAKADADNVIAETNETNNTKYKTIKTGPDLIVSAVTAPATSGAGKAISVTDTTKNSGGCPSGATTTKIYLSTNSSWDALDTLIGSRAVPALAAGATDTGSISVTIPAGTTSGTRYIIARADADNVVAELNETNNNKSKSIKIGPDLTVSTLSAPTSAVRGATITVTTAIKNNGGGDAGASTTKLYLSSNNIYDAGDTYLGERAVPNIVAGATNSGSTSVTIPSGITAGIYYIISVADANAVVLETVETNNNKYKSITLN